MSKLSKLYTMISNAEELGIKLGNDVYHQTNKLEEELIKKEILPVVKERIEPALHPIQRELTLIVDYVPGASVRVRLSRDMGLSDEEGFVELTPDPQALHSTHKGGKSSNRQPKSGIRIIRKDNSIIQEKTAAATLVKAIKEAGPLKVRDIGIICCKVPLVATSKDAKYESTQVEVKPGLYVITHSNNQMKKNYLETISKVLHLGWKVEILMK